MVTRRDIGVSFAPAKRAAVWPRPSREPGRWPACWPLPPAVGRRTADLPPLALPACLSTLETKLWPWPLPRFFGAPGRTQKSWSPRSVMAVLPKLRRVRARSTRTCLHRRVPRAHAARRRSCRAAPPTCRLALRAAECRTLCLAFRLCPRSRSGHRRPGGCCTSSQPAGEHANGRRPGAFEEDAHVWRGCRRQREVRCECTAPLTTRRRTVERHARWHDERRGKVQRIGGHHGRVSSQIGCATPITANALTGPK